MNKISVMIIDDSAVMRKFLTDTIESDRRFEVVGTAMDPYIAANKIPKLKPDVITLDIEMPRMDGLTFLSKLMIANPLPVIMVSTLTEKGATATMKALELGALDFVTKPNIDNEASKEAFKNDLLEKLAGATSSKITARAPVNLEVAEKFSADVILKKADPVKNKTHSDRIIAIGASTGGTEVIDAILTGLPDNLPGIVITQHMPEKFTEAFANRVNSKSKLLVKEAEDGERLYSGMALIAPGGLHMLLRSDSKGYYVEINDGPPVNRHKPSVDVLYRSVVQSAGELCLGIICTGMGNDGAAGMKELRDAGARTIGQNESSCIVYGMPREAFRLGGIQKETDIEGIIQEIIQFSR